MTPELVEHFFKETTCDTVVDPFVGSGTVGVETVVRGLKFIGIDSNPVSVVISLAKLKPYTSVRLRPSSRLSDYYLPDVLDSLLSLAKRVNTALEVAVFLKVARSLSLLRHSPAPKFRQSIAVDDPIDLFNKLLDVAVMDTSLVKGNAEVVWGDSTVWLPRRVCGVLTSPPFANNVDYARHTMLELMWLGVDVSYARSLQLPACEAATRSFRHSLDIDIQFRGMRANGYKRFYGQYLYYMRRHFQLLADALEWEAWYTIGDSHLGGVYVPVHEHLKKLAEETGLKTDVIKLTSRPVKKSLSLFLLRLTARR